MLKSFRIWKVTVLVVMVSDRMHHCGLRTDFVKSRRGIDLAYAKIIHPHVFSQVNYSSI